MDYEFRQNETGTTAEDTRHENWLSAVSKLLGFDVAPGSDDDSELFDYYSDGCTPSEAAQEYQAQRGCTK